MLNVIAGRIASVLRRGEELFHIGGDEFAVVLMRCDGPRPLRIAERCHEKIVGYDFSRLESASRCVSAQAWRRRGWTILKTCRTCSGRPMWRCTGRSDRGMPIGDVATEARGARDSEGLFSKYGGFTTPWSTERPADALPAHRRSGAADLPLRGLVRIEQDGEVIMRPTSSRSSRRVVWRSNSTVPYCAGCWPICVGARSSSVPASRSTSPGPSVVHEQVCAWFDDFKPLLKDYRVMIEVTETALITQIGLANENLTRLQQLGFEIALDDFGSYHRSAIWPACRSMQ